VSWAKHWPANNTPMTTARVVVIGRWFFSHRLLRKPTPALSVGNSRYLTNNIKSYSAWSTCFGTLLNVGNYLDGFIDVTYGEGTYYGAVWQ